MAGLNVVNDLDLSDSLAGGPQLLHVYMHAYTHARTPDYMHDSVWAQVLAHVCTHFRPRNTARNDQHGSPRAPQLSECQHFPHKPLLLH